MHGQPAEFHTEVYCGSSISTVPTRTSHKVTKIKIKAIPHRASSSGMTLVVIDITTPSCACIATNAIPTPAMYCHSV